MPPTSRVDDALRTVFETVKSEFACTYNEPSTESVMPLMVIGELDATVDKPGFVRLSTGEPVNNSTSLLLELTENCPTPIGNAERLVSVRSVTLEKEAPVDKETPSGETMNKLAFESRLKGTLRLKPLDDEATPKMTLLWESVSIVTPEMEVCEVLFASNKVKR